MIRFPQIHVAESTVNRILNTWDEIQSQRVAAAAPVVPSNPGAGTQTESMNLDARLQSSPGPMAVPDGLAPTIQLQMPAPTGGL